MSENWIQLRKEDFSAHGLALGIWDKMLDGLPADTDEVVISVVGAAKDSEAPDG